MLFSCSFLILRSAARSLSNSLTHVFCIRSSTVLRWDSLPRVRLITAAIGPWILLRNSLHASSPPESRHSCSNSRIDSFLTSMNLPTAKFYSTDAVRWPPKDQKNQKFNRLRVGSSPLGQVSLRRWFRGRHEITSRPRLSPHIPGYWRAIFYSQTTSAWILAIHTRLAVTCGRLQSSPVWGMPITNGALYSFSRS